MSLLSVTVKRAKFVGPNAEQLNTYVTLQLQSVKSTTITVKGSSPAWEQDFLFETNQLDSGLLIEIWNKGLIWDKVIGCIWLPLHHVPYSNQEGTGEWLSVDAEQVIENGAVIATRNPTGHYILIDCRLEMANEIDDPDTTELQKKLEAFNYVLDQEMAILRDSNKRQQFFNHSGLSEDSDYTSDVSYPLNHQANSSASQYLTVASEYYTPQRSLENSRDNSYERDTKDLNRWDSREYRQYENYSQGDQYYQDVDQRYLNEWNYEAEDPLYYNSRPPTSKTEERFSYKSSIDTECVEGAFGAPGDAQQKQASFARTGKGRKPSLERQSTLYDEYETNCSYYNNGENYESNKRNESVINYGEWAQSSQPKEAKYEQQEANQQQQQQQSQDQNAYEYVDPNAAYDGYDYSSYENCDGYYYNYDYNGAYSDQSAWTEYEGKEECNAEGYGYSDETGYYYNGQWYTWDSYANYAESNSYDEYGYQEGRADLIYAEEPTKDEGEVREPDTDLKHELPGTKRRLLHHGDLSSSGGSVDSEQLLLRRESSASVATPTTELRLIGSPVGELDRLQSDLESKHYSDSKGPDSRLSGRYSVEEERRRSSVQSHGSSLSRRERADEFHRRRSSSICSEQASQLNSFDDHGRTPVNEDKYDDGILDATPVPSESSLPLEPEDSGSVIQKNVSFEDEQIQPEPLPESPKQGIVPSLMIVERPRLTARQRWLIAFNKVCAQLNVSQYHFIHYAFACCIIISASIT